MPGSLTAAIYARVSTADQDYEMQLAEARPMRCVPCRVLFLQLNVFSIRASVLTAPDIAKQRKRKDLR